MTSRRFFLSVLVAFALFFSPLASAQQPDQKKEIDALIAQLSSPDQATRTAAQEKLIGMGEEARKALEEYLRSRSAIEATLAKLEINKVAAPTLITLKVKDASIDDVVKELTRQSSYPLYPPQEGAFMPAGPEGPPKLTLSAEKQPFWQVFRQFCTQAELTVMHNNERRIQLYPSRQMGGQNLMKCPSAVNGAFMAIVTNIQRTNNVDLSNPQVIHRNMYLNLNVLIEPKVNIVQASYNPEIDEAVDDKGNSLTFDANRAPYSMSRGNRGYIWQTNIGLQYPAANAGTKIAKLRGKFRCIAQTRSEKFEIPDIMKAKELTKTVGNRRFTFKEIRKIGDRNYQVTIVFYRDGMDPQQFYESAQNPSIRLVDEQEGREYSFNGLSGGGSRGDSFEAKLNFYARPDGAGGPVAGEPTKLIWEIPTATQELQIPFEFTDLPLP